MKKLIAIAALVAMIGGFAVDALAYGLHRVKGHYRSNGTYVNSYARSNPDGYTFNNLSNW